MSQTNTPHKYQQRPVEDILDFCTLLGSRMIASGANLERVQLAVERISRSYGLTDVSLYLLSTNISLSARDNTGYYAIRQRSIPAVKLQMNRLQSLNSLCYSIAKHTPSPKDLRGLLDDASNVDEYSDHIVLLGQICAMSLLCLLFGGWFREVICVVMIITVVHYTLRMIEIARIDKILTNALTMWIATTIVFLLTGFGISDNKPVLIITATMMIIPGIPLVNAMRNILCGNEMNGILQTARATVETFAIGMGIYVFGVMFGVKPRDLWLAGLGGALTRIVMLLMFPVATRLASVTVSALAASFYAEFLATLNKKPSTYYIYPTIIPLIPGDLFFYALLGVYNHNPEMVRTNGINCALTLAGMSIGFVLSFVAAHYIRGWRLATSHGYVPGGRRR